MVTGEGDVLGRSRKVGIVERVAWGWPVSYTHLDVYKRQLCGILIRFLRLAQFMGSCGIKIKLNPFFS